MALFIRYNFRCVGFSYKCAGELDAYISGAVIIFIWQKTETKIYCLLRKHFLSLSSVMAQVFYDCNEHTVICSILPGLVRTVYTTKGTLTLGQVALYRAEAQSCPLPGPCWPALTLLQVQAGLSRENSCTSVTTL